MSPKLTTSLIATALQKLEAIHHNETEVLSDDECRARAEEIAKAALEAIAVCTKFVLSTEGEAEIKGLGQFYLSKAEIRFNPESDVLAFAVAKKQDHEKQQYALRNAFVKCITNALDIIPQLEFASTGSQKNQEEVDLDTPEQWVVEAIFGGPRPNRFGPTVSQLLASMIERLQSSGLIIDAKVADTFSSTAQEAELVRIVPPDLLRAELIGGITAEWLKKARQDLKESKESARRRESTSNE
jgi:hypothetical protein